MADVKIKELEAQLMDNIDNDDKVQCDKVRRYLDGVEIIRKLRAAVKREGATITIENGGQKYVKTHPAIAEINKLNATLLALERSFEWKENNEEPDAGDLID